MGQVVEAMKQIITTGDLRRRVELEYGDEVGELGHTFNLMTGELEKAYNQIKSYAFRAAVAQRKEQKIRQIFQKYVPADVIDQFFSNPESMLVGEKRSVAVLFTDIRNFTTISEMLAPDEVVESLNAYFGPMVDVVVAHGGIVDKFVGDAIMAVFGAPVKHDNDALQAVNAGFGIWKPWRPSTPGKPSAGGLRSRWASGSTSGKSPWATSARRRRWTTR
jgi:hypothetical protein